MDHTGGHQAGGQQSPREGAQLQEGRQLDELERELDVMDSVLAALDADDLDAAEALAGRG